MLTEESELLEVHVEALHAQLDELQRWATSDRRAPVPVLLTPRLGPATSRLNTVSTPQRLTPFKLASSCTEQLRARGGTAVAVAGAAPASLRLPPLPPLGPLATSRSQEHSSSTCSTAGAWPDPQAQPCDAPPPPAADAADASVQTSPPGALCGARGNPFAGLQALDAAPATEPHAATSGGAQGEQPSPWTPNASALPTPSQPRPRPTSLSLSLAASAAQALPSPAWPLGAAGGRPGDAAQAGEAAAAAAHSPAVRRLALQLQEALVLCAQQRQRAELLQVTL